jgi:hypothetical protein
MCRVLFKELQGTHSAQMNRKSGSEPRQEQIFHGLETGILKYFVFLLQEEEWESISRFLFC